MGSAANNNIDSLIESLQRIESDEAKISEHAVLMCHLADYQDKLDEAVDAATIEYLHAQAIARDKLQRLRKAIDVRDAMSKARKYVGSEKC